MADGVNKAILIGNLGSDPELRMTNSGQACLKFNLATSRTYLDRNRQRQQNVQWHKVIVWGKSAEGLGKFLSKGMKMYIEGRIETREYEDRDGNKRYITEIVADSTVVLTSKGENGGGGYRRDRGDDPRYDEPEERDSYDSDRSDDIPF